MSPRSPLIVKAMNFIFWIIFIGLCIKTGAVLISFLVSLFINPNGAKNLYLGLNLFDLFTFDKLHYSFIVSFIIVLTGLKAYIAYLVLRISLKFKFSSPFKTNINLLMFKISHVAVGTGILAIIANAYGDWLIKKGTPISLDWGSSEILFFAGVIYIITLVFKKGIEIQSENELTV